MQSGLILINLVFLGLVYQICCTISTIPCQLKESFIIVFHAVSAVSCSKTKDCIFDKVSEFEVIVEKKTVCHSFDKMTAKASTFCLYYIFRSSRQGVFCEKGVPRNFAKFTENSCARVSFLMKLQTLGL